MTDSDWRVRKATVENLELYIKSNVSYFPEDHYEKNEKSIQFMEGIIKRDFSDKVRNAAAKIVQNPKYSKKALEKLHENDIREINYTVVDASKDMEKRVHLIQNEKFEYVCHPDSVEEIFDYCFGGDIVTVTYSTDHTELVVDYNILDRHIANADKIPIEGQYFDRVITYENMASQNLSKDKYQLFSEDVASNETKKVMLLYFLHTRNDFFLVRKGQKLKFNGHDLLGGAKVLLGEKPEIKLTTDQMMVRIDLTVKDIEFVCRKINQFPISENVSVYRQ